jgi:type 2 lantibiotic biosynthesis protein LanM
LLHDAAAPAPSDSLLASPLWYAALSLGERAALPGVPPTPAAGSELLAQAAARAERWRRETHLTDDARFAARLAVDGVPPDAFLAYLAEPPESLAARAGEPPWWLRRLAEDWRAGTALPLPVDGAALGLLEMVRPLLAAGWRRAADRLQGIAGPDGRPVLPPAALARELLAPLLAHCRVLISRAAILELQVARLEGRLAGETPETRFASFVESLRDPEQALALLALYPLLARDVVEQVAHWEETTAELADHLAADLPDLARALGCAAGDLGPVDRLVFGLGDRHRRGRTVVRVSFAGGFQAVYKPRSLALDARFQEVVCWLNGQGLEPALRTAWVLDRGFHGWMENIVAAPCADRAELARFFRRQGALLALLHALDATDFHHENLIAAGEHPVPVDLETLCHPLLFAADQPDSFVAVAETVLRVGLLPHPFWQDQQRSRLDLSGMGAAAGQVADVQLVTGAGTDQMRVVTAAREVPVAPSRPNLAGAPVGPWELRGEILAGLRGMFSLLAERRAALLAPAGPLAGWPELPGRAVVRATALYVELLVPSRHPDFLKSGLDRARLFDRLWFDTLDFPSLARVVPAEIADLWRGDVPRFGTVLGARDLWTAPEEGEPADRIPGFFPESGFERVRRRLAGLGAAEVERQAWLAAAALATLCPAEATPPRRARTELPPAAAPAGRERLLAAARAVGDRLAALAIRSGGQLTWFHTAHDPRGGRQVEPLGLDFYNGLPGMALFFGQLAAQTGEAGYGEIARAALATARRRLERNPAVLRSAGAFNGRGGLLYAWGVLGRLWDEDALLSEAREWARGLPAVGADDPECDLIGGLAGGLAGLLALHRVGADPEVRAAAVACGELLLARAEQGERGTTWPSVAGSPPPPPLTGLAHGMAGIAWPLAELAVVSGEGRFLAAAQGAVAYERSWFSPAKGTWRDLRVRDAEAHACAWCHGAAGIGLSRLAIRPFWNDPEIDTEIRAAVAAVQSEGFGSNHSLCHGDLGNLDLLLEAARHLGDPGLEREAGLRAARILAGIERDGWLCGTAAGAELPGLMAGLAGIGYGLLRCAEPGVPSVLTLAIG